MPLTVFPHRSAALAGMLSIVSFLSAALRFTVDRTTYSFGTVPDNTGAVQADFTVTNAGDAPHALNIRHSCRCVSEKYDTLIPAGRNGKIVIALDLSNTGKVCMDAGGLNDTGQPEDIPPGSLHSII